MRLFEQTAAGVVCERFRSPSAPPPFRVPGGVTNPKLRSTADNDELIIKGPRQEVVDKVA